MCFKFTETETLKWEDSFCRKFHQNPVNINRGKFQPWTYFPNHGKFHSVLDKNTVFGQIWAKNSKLFASAEIWYYFKCAEFDGDVRFSCLRQETSFLGKLCPKNQNHLLKMKFIYLD